MSAEERQKWDAVHAERGFFPVAPSVRITNCRGFLPAQGGRALDVAGGAGRHALWLAACGFTVTLADISSVALEIAQVEAAKRELSLEVVCADFDRDPFPNGPWDVVLCHHYLHRSLIDCLGRDLPQNGVLLYVQPTLRNLERHPKPSARFLLQEGELLEQASRGDLEVISYTEDWGQEGRHEAVLVARRKQKEAGPIGQGG